MNCKKIYEDEDYFLWSLLYSEPKNETTNFNSPLVPTEFLYKLYFSTINEKINLFQLNRTNLFKRIESLFKGTKYREDTKLRVLEVFKNIDKLKKREKKK